MPPPGGKCPYVNEGEEKSMLFTCAPHAAAANEIMASPRISFFNFIDRFSNFDSSNVLASHDPVGDGTGIF